MPASLSPRILHPSSDTLLPSTGPLPPRFFRSNSRDESGFSSINRWPLALALAYHPLPIPRNLQLFFLFLSSLSAQLLFLSFFSFFDFQSRSFLRLSLRKINGDLLFNWVEYNRFRARDSEIPSGTFVYTSIKISPKETGSARSFSLYSPIVQANSSIDFGS